MSVCEATGLKNKTVDDVTQSGDSGVPAPDDKRMDDSRNGKELQEAPEALLRSSSMRVPLPLITRWSSRSPTCDFSTDDKLQFLLHLMRILHV